MLSSSIKSEKIAEKDFERQEQGAKCPRSKSSVKNWLQSSTTKETEQQKYIRRWHFDPPNLEIPKQFRGTTKTGDCHLKKSRHIKSNTARISVSKTSKLASNGIDSLSTEDSDGWQEINNDLDVDIQKCPDIEYRIFYRIRKPMIKIEPCYPISVGNSCLQKVLTETMYSSLANQRSSLGATLEDCIRPGLDSPEESISDSSANSLERCGVIACDEDCYYKFRPLFRNVLQNIYPDVILDPCDQSQQRTTDLSNWANIDELPDLDIKYVDLLEIESHRNLNRYKFVPRMDRAERRHVTALLIKVLQKTAEGHTACLELSEVTNEVSEDLKTHGLFPEPPNGMYDISAGLRRDWPDGRAIWFCKNPCLIAYLNIVDHLVVVARKGNGHIWSMVKQLGHFFDTLTAILDSSDESFAEDVEHEFGNLTTFPEMSGTGVICRAVVRLQNLTKNETSFNSLCTKLGLTVRRKEFDVEKKCNLITFETKRSLGYDDSQLIKMFVGDIERIIKLEIEQSVDEELFKTHVESS